MTWTKFLRNFIWMRNCLPLFPAETNQRLQIFHQNLKTAEKLQSLDQGSAEYGVTKFSDLTGACVCLCVAQFQMRIYIFELACLTPAPLQKHPLKSTLTFILFSFQNLYQRKNFAPRTWTPCWVSGLSTSQWNLPFPPRIPPLPAGIGGITVPSVLWRTRYQQPAAKENNNTACHMSCFYK